MLSVAAACLVATGCSAVSSLAKGAASAQAPHPAASAKAGQSNLAGPPVNPFAGTPADRWAGAPAGIVPPAAAPVGPFTKAQVEYAYGMMRKLLVAANLDQQTLHGGAPTAFADLLTSQQKAWFDGGLDEQGLDKQGHQASTRAWVMSFAPGSAQLIGSVIKVNGSMHAKAVKNSNGAYELDIDIDYLFVYPVEPPRQPYNWMRVVSEVAWTVGFANWPGAASSFAPWLTSPGTTTGVDGANCSYMDGYTHPDYPDNTGPGAHPSDTPSGTPVDPYVAGQARVVGCHATTGT